MTAGLFATPEKVEAYRHLLPLRRVTEIADVCEAVVFLASCKARGITGEVLAVDSGYLAIGGW
jgi:enoyl-[acyl-carrier-protein] reductase (NADH)